MSLVLLVIVVGALAYLAGRWWAVAIAPTVGLAIGGVMTGTGGSLPLVTSGVAVGVPPNEGTTANSGTPVTADPHISRIVAGHGVASTI